MTESLEVTPADRNGWWEKMTKDWGEITKLAFLDKSTKAPCRVIMLIVYYASTAMLLVIYYIYGKKIADEFKDRNIFADDMTGANGKNSEQGELLKTEFTGIMNLWGTIPLHPYLYKVFLFSFLMSSIALLLSEFILPINLYFRAQIFNKNTNVENNTRWWLVGAIGMVLLSEPFYMIFAWRYMKGYKDEKNMHNKGGSFLALNTPPECEFSQTCNDGPKHHTHPSDHNGLGAHHIVGRGHSYDRWWYAMVVQLFISSISAVFAAFLTWKAKDRDYKPEGSEEYAGMEKNAGCGKSEGVYGGGAMGEFFSFCYTARMIKLAQYSAILFAFHVTVFDLFIYPWFFKF